jgi:hypothetical protein
VLASGTIYRATSSRPWPGAAAITICELWLRVGPWEGSAVLDEREVGGIGADLREAFGAEPVELAECLYAFEGVHNARGLAFVVEAEHPLANHQLFKPYVSGEDFTQRHPLMPPRCVLDLTGWTEPDLQRLPAEVADYLHTVVRPTRTPAELASYKGLASRWWTFWNTRDEGFDVARRDPVCLAMASVAKYLLAIALPSAWVFTNKAVVVAKTRPDVHTLLLSSAFDVWAEKYGGSMDARRVMKVGPVIRTFPMPRSVADASLGDEWQRLALESLRHHGPGITDVFNSVHDPSVRTRSIEKLREVGARIHGAVLAAYGWADLATPFAFVEVEDGTRWGLSSANRLAILRRLLALNQERYTEEVAAGLHERKKKGSRRGAQAGDRQGSLL